MIDNITKYSVLDLQIELSRPTGTETIELQLCIYNKQPTLETKVNRTSTKKTQNMQLFIKNIPCQVHFLVHHSTAPTYEHKSSGEKQYKN